MWVLINFYTTFVIYLIFHVLVGSLHEDFGKHLGVARASYSHNNFPSRLTNRNI